MDIEIFARCIYVAPEISHNRLAVTMDADGDVFIEYVLFEPSGRERNAYRKKFPAEFLVPGTMYALVEFWDNYLLIEHRAGTYDGVYGAHSMQHKATFAVGAEKLLVLTNTPVADGPNIHWNHGAESFWSAVRTFDPAFAAFEINAKTKAEIAAQIDANSAVAALEAQVDLLTDLVLSIIDDTNQDAKKLRKIFNDYGLLTIKNKGELRDEVAARKALVRMKQLERRTKVLEAKQAALLYQASVAEAEEAQAAATAAAQALQANIDGKKAKIAELAGVLRAL